MRLIVFSVPGTNLSLVLLTFFFFFFTCKSISINPAGDLKTYYVSLTEGEPNDSTAWFLITNYINDTWAKIWLSLSHRYSGSPGVKKEWV